MKANAITLAVIVATVGAARTAAAERAVLLHDGGKSKVVEAFVSGVAHDLSDMDVVRERRALPGDRSAFVDAVVKVIKDNNAALVIDARLRTPKSFVVRVVGRDATPIYDGSANVKKNGTQKVKTLAKAMVRAIRLFRDRHAEESAPAAEPEPQVSQADPAAAEDAANSGSPSALPAAGEAPAAVGETPEWARSWANPTPTAPAASTALKIPKLEEEPIDRPYRFSLAAGPAGTRFVDRLSTGVGGSEVNITVPQAGGARLAGAFEWRNVLGVEGEVEMMRSAIANTLPGGSPSEISLSGQAVTLLLDARYKLGPLSFVVGGRQETQVAPHQDPVPVVTSTQRFLGLAGVAFRVRDLDRSDWALRTWLLAIPFGSQREAPVTSGADPSIKGASLTAAFSYKLPLGFFAEARAGMEYMKASFHGAGTRAQADGTAFEAVSQARLLYRGAISAGYTL